MPFDVQFIRHDFPILARQVHGKPLVYLDNAATAQKPLAVIEMVDRYYRQLNSNIHRGVHALSVESTIAYDEAREKVGKFMHARSSGECIFVRNATEAINLVAQAWGRTFLKAGDEIVLSITEHHANIVPWQLLAKQVGCVIKVIPVDDCGVLDQVAFEKMLTSKVKLLAIGHVSNALGTINPVKAMVQKAKADGITVLVDGAQAVPHLRIDVQDLGCDFYVFTGHKLFGPTGIGVLWGKEELLNAMPPYQGGGDMIERVSFETETLFKKTPGRFEAGTPHIAGAIGLGAAVDYMEKLDFDAVCVYENQLLDYATQRLSEVKGLRIIGTAPEKVSLISFVFDEIHPHDVGTILDAQGVAVRAGHHCAMPLMNRLGVPATTRASFAFYNTREEIDALIAALHKVQKMFS